MMGWRGQENETVLRLVEALHWNLYGNTEEKQEPV
jgi:hypothetical protein